MGNVTNEDGGAIDRGRQGPISDFTGRWMKREEDLIFSMLFSVTYQYICRGILSSL